MDVPTESEMAEIEPSSRLYERDGALYMTVSVLYGRQDGQPRTTPISFVLTDNRLVTVRYATPEAGARLCRHARRDRDWSSDAPTALVRMLDAIIDRLADELEDVGRDDRGNLRHIFHRKMDERRIPADRLTALLTRIGRTQTLLAKIRYSAVSTMRMLSFLGGANRFHEEGRANFATISPASAPTPRRSASMRASCRDNLKFLLDASLGPDQHRAECGDEAVFLGRRRVPAADADRRHLRDELPLFAANSWHYGYPISLGLMVASAVGPYLYFKRRGWI